MLLTESKHKILIIEDDKSQATSLSDILTDHGYQADIAENYAIARTYLTSTHLAIIDLQLPDKPGTELLRELKEVNPEAEALIITAYADTQTAVDALNLGAFGYLKKPVNPDRVLLLLRRALEKRQMVLEIKRREQEIKGLTGFTGNILNERIRLLEQARGREERLSKLYYGIGLSFRALNPVEAARMLLPLIAEETKANCVSLNLIGTDRKMIERVESFKGIEPFKIRTRIGGTCDEVSRTLRPIIISDLEKYGNPNPHALARGIKSVFVYPLIVEDAVYAVLFLSSLKRNAFAGMEQIVASFADLCAIPLRQSIIHMETDRARKAWEATVNAMRIGIAIIDTERNIIQANKTLADIVKVPVENLPGKKICTLIHGHAEQLPGCPMEKFCESGEASSVVIRENFVNINRLELRVAPIESSQGETTRFVHICRDLDIFRSEGKPE